MLPNLKCVKGAIVTLAAIAGTLSDLDTVGSVLPTITAGAVERSDRHAGSTSWALEYTIHSAGSAGQQTASQYLLILWLSLTNTETALATP